MAGWFWTGPDDGPSIYRELEKSCPSITGFPPELHSIVAARANSPRPPVLLPYLIVAGFIFLGFGVIHVGTATSKTVSELLTCNMTAHQTRWREIQKPFDMAWEYFVSLVQEEDILLNNQCPISDAPCAPTCHVNDTLAALSDSCELRRGDEERKEAYGLAMMDVLFGNQTAYERHVRSLPLSCDIYWLVVTNVTRSSPIGNITVIPKPTAGVPVYLKIRPWTALLWDITWTAGLLSALAFRDTRFLVLAAFCTYAASRIDKMFLRL